MMLFVLGLKKYDYTTVGMSVLQEVFVCVLSQPRVFSATHII